MADERKKVWPERGHTDESLRVEREKTDRALSEKQAAVEHNADAVVHRAREKADAVLEAARDIADERLDHATTPPTFDEEGALAQERRVADAVLRTERATADASLLREREANARVLAKLLPLERDKTDRFLLTERARSDDALANRDDFLGIVSHDLRNLLGGIVMSASELSEYAPESGDAGRIAEETKRIQRYAARMNRLIGDLVDVASIDAGALAMTSMPGDGVTLIAEAIDLFEASAAAKGISLVASEVEPTLLASFDHDRLLQVFANVITNAVKFTPRGGHVSLSGRRQADAVRFSVTDNGPGIPANMLGAIFERFWQVGQNDRRGLGLGLYISKCIIEAHGGKIWAESKGAGSTLVFTLPVTT